MKENRGSVAICSRCWIITLRFPYKPIKERNLAKNPLLEISRNDVTSLTLGFASSRSIEEIFVAREWVPGLVDETLKFAGKWVVN